MTKPKGVLPLLLANRVAKMSTAPMPPCYEDMCRSMEAAYQVDEVKNIRDKTLALEVYAKQMMNVEAERQACEIRLRAERGFSRLLRQQVKAKARAAAGNPTLADLGITRKQAAEWQALAEVPDDAFEKALATSGKKSAASIVATYKGSQG